MKNNNLAKNFLVRSPFIADISSLRFYSVGCYRFYSVGCLLGAGTRPGGGGLNNLSKKAVEFKNCSGLFSTITSQLPDKI